MSLDDPKTVEMLRRVHRKIDADNSGGWNFEEMKRYYLETERIDPGAFTRDGFDDALKRFGARGENEVSLEAYLRMINFTHGHLGKELGDAYIAQILSSLDVVSPNSVVVLDSSPVPASNAKHDQLSDSEPHGRGQSASPIHPFFAGAKRLASSNNPSTSSTTTGNDNINTKRTTTSTATSKRAKTVSPPAGVMNLGAFFKPVAPPKEKHEANKHLPAPNKESFETVDLVNDDVPTSVIKETENKKTINNFFLPRHMQQQQQQQQGPRPPAVAASQDEPPVEGSYVHSEFFEDTSFFACADGSLLPTKWSLSDFPRFLRGGNRPTNPAPSATAVSSSSPTEPTITTLDEFPPAQEELTSSFNYVEDSSKLWSRVLSPPLPSNKTDGAKREEVSEDETVLWTERYRPHRGAEVIGNLDAVEALKEWTRLFTATHNRPSSSCSSGRNSRRAGAAEEKEESEEEDLAWGDTDDEDRANGGDPGEAKCALLVGPVGSGKTCSVYAVAKEFGFQVIENNASDDRTGDRLRALVGEASKQSHGIRKGRGAAPRLAQTLILVDEIDVAFAEDDKFFASLRTLVKSTRAPVVLTCNVLPPELSCDRQLVTVPSAAFRCETMRFARPEPGVLTSWMTARGMQAASARVERLDCDVRASLLDAQLWHGEASPLDNMHANAPSLDTKKTCDDDGSANIAATERPAPRVESVTPRASVAGSKVRIRGRCFAGWPGSVHVELRLGSGNVMTCDDVQVISDEEIAAVVPRWDRESDDDETSNEAGADPDEEDDDDDDDIEDSESEEDVFEDSPSDKRRGRKKRGVPPARVFADVVVTVALNTLGVSRRSDEDPTSRHNALLELVNNKTKRNSRVISDEDDGDAREDTTCASSRVPIVLAARGERMESDRDEDEYLRFSLERAQDDFITGRRRPDIAVYTTPYADDIVWEEPSNCDSLAESMELYLSRARGRGGSEAKSYEELETARFERRAQHFRERCEALHVRSPWDGRGYREAFSQEIPFHVRLSRLDVILLDKRLARYYRRRKGNSDREEDDSRDAPTGVWGRAGFSMTRRRTRSAQLLRKPEPYLHERAELKSWLDPHALARLSLNLDADFAKVEGKLLRGDEEEENQGTPTVSASYLESDDRDEDDDDEEESLS